MSGIEPREKSSGSEPLPDQTPHAKSGGPPRTFSTIAPEDKKTSSSEEPKPKSKGLFDEARTKWVGMSEADKTNARNQAQALRAGLSTEKKTELAESQVAFKNAKKEFQAAKKEAIKEWKALEEPKREELRQSGKDKFASLDQSKQETLKAGATTVGNVKTYKREQARKQAFDDFARDKLKEEKINDPFDAYVKEEVKSKWEGKAEESKGKWDASSEARQTELKDAGKAAGNKKVDELVEVKKARMEKQAKREKDKYIHNKEVATNSKGKWDEIDAAKKADFKTKADNIRGKATEVKGKEEGLDAAVKAEFETKAKAKWASLSANEQTKLKEDISRKIKVKENVSRKVRKAQLNTGWFELDQAKQAELRKGAPESIKAGTLVDDITRARVEQKGAAAKGKWDAAGEARQTDLKESAKAGTLVKDEMMAKLKEKAPEAAKGAYRSAVSQAKSDHIKAARNKYPEVVPAVRAWKKMKKEEKAALKVEAKNKFEAMDPAQQARIREKAEKAVEKYDAALDLKKKEIGETAAEKKEAWDSLSDEEKKELTEAEMWKYIETSIMINMINDMERQNKESIRIQKEQQRGS